MLLLLARSLDTRTIARSLGLSEKTVYNYTASIVSKLHVRDRIEGGDRAREVGMNDGTSSWPEASKQRRDRHR